MKLGNPENLTDEARLRGTIAGTAARVAKADAFAAKLLPVIEAIRAEGWKSHNDIANELRSKGILNPRGKTSWWPEQVRRIINRSA